MKNKTLRVLVGDPGKTNDPFGVVGMEGTWPQRKIYTRLAKQFKRKPYSTVAKYFERQDKHLQFDLMILEKNFDYPDVSKAFAHLPIMYINTSSTLTLQRRAEGWALDKPYMIKWMQQEHKKHTLQYPVKQSVDMVELENQRNQIVGIATPGGSTSYKAQRGRHDDLFMAELIGANTIRGWWDTQ